MGLYEGVSGVEVLESAYVGQSPETALGPLPGAPLGTCTPKGRLGTLGRTAPAGH